MVTVASSTKMNIINSSNGTVVASFSYSGELVTGPVSSGDKCTYVVKYPSNQKKGFIINLPQGTINSTFSV